MGTLYLVRHGQASFGADDYDCLSALGERQSRRLGEYFKLRGLRFEAALAGTLRRQQQTLAGISEGLGSSIPTQLWPGLNEYDSDALIAKRQRDGALALRQTAAVEPDDGGEGLLRSRRIHIEPATLV